MLVYLEFSMFSDCLFRLFVQIELREICKCCCNITESAFFSFVTSYHSLNSFIYTFFVQKKTKTKNKITCFASALNSISYLNENATNIRSTIFCLIKIYTVHCFCKLFAVINDQTIKLFCCSRWVSNFVEICDNSTKFNENNNNIN